MRTRRLRRPPFSFPNMTSSSSSFSSPKCRVHTSGLPITSRPIVPPQRSTSVTPITTSLKSASTGQRFTLLINLDGDPASDPPSSPLALPTLASAVLRRRRGDTCIKSIVQPRISPYRSRIVRNIVSFAQRRVWEDKPHAVTCTRTPRPLDLVVFRIVFAKFVSLARRRVGGITACYDMHSSVSPIRYRYRSSVFVHSHPSPGIVAGRITATDIVLLRSQSPRLTKLIAQHSSKDRRPPKAPPSAPSR